MNRRCLPNSQELGYNCMSYIINGHGFLSGSKFMIISNLKGKTMSTLNGPLVTLNPDPQP